MVKRESLGNVANDQDLDSKLYLLQANNLSLGNETFTRGSFLALWGQEEDPTKDYEYWTAGGEVAFHWPSPDDSRHSFNGTLSGYYSERDANEADDGTRASQDARGRTGLLTLTYARLAKKLEPGKFLPQIVSPWSLSVFGGFGSSDDPNTPRDEGYVGETASFSPDRLFLKGFAANIDTAGEGAIGPSLSNKRYGSIEFSYNRDNYFSPLRFFAKSILRLKEDFNVQNTKLRLHHYRFREPVFGSKDAGMEVDLTFEQEVPKGATWTLGFGYFFVGDALEDVIVDDPWSISFAANVKLGG